MNILGPASARSLADGTYCVTLTAVQLAHEGMSNLPALSTAVAAMVSVGEGLFEAWRRRGEWRDDDDQIRV
jgi:hypothetical protein